MGKAGEPDTVDLFFKPLNSLNKDSLVNVKLVSLQN